MFKEFFLKKIMASQLKGAGLSEEQQTKLIEMVSKNPELFKKIALEAQVLIKEQGMDQMKAVMQVAEKYKTELNG